MTHFRPSIAEINLSQLAKNLNHVRSLLGPADKICAIIKADAYGHGAVQVARTLEKESIAAFGVATMEEGLQLVEANITKQPIIVMDGLMGEGEIAAEAVLRTGLTPVVHSTDVLPLLDSAAKYHNKRVSIHVKIDTGMTRLGLRPEGLAHFCRVFAETSNIDLHGVMTHFADALDEKYTAEQLAQFNESGKILTDNIGEIPVWHAANSAGVLKKAFGSTPMCGERWVRPGVLLYGGLPDDEFIGKTPIKSVMTIKSRVILIKRVPKGTKVSYGCTYETRRESRIGIVPIGYADGYPLSLSNRSSVSIGGKLAPVIGRVTMDLTMVDLTDLPEVSVGNSVVLLGSGDGRDITVEEFANWGEMLPYEVLCGISKRMPRVYVE